MAGEGRRSDRLALAEGKEKTKEMLSTSARTIPSLPFLALPLGPREAYGQAREGGKGKRNKRLSISFFLPPALPFLSATIGLSFGRREGRGWVEG